MNPAPIDLYNVLSYKDRDSIADHMDAVRGAAAVLDGILVALANAASDPGGAEPNIPCDLDSAVALARLGRDLLFCSTEHTRRLFELARGDHLGGVQS